MCQLVVVYSCVGDAERGQLQFINFFFPFSLNQGVRMIKLIDLTALSQLQFQNVLIACT